MEYRIAWGFPFKVLSYYLRVRKSPSSRLHVLCLLLCSASVLLPGLVFGYCASVVSVKWHPSVSQGTFRRHYLKKLSVTIAPHDPSSLSGIKSLVYPVFSCFLINSWHPSVGCSQNRRNNKDLVEWMACMDDKISYSIFLWKLGCFIEVIWCQRSQFCAHK